MADHVYCAGAPRLVLVSLMVGFVGLVSARGGHEIIVIEKGPNGLYVATSEHYYAFTHPELSELSWSRNNKVLVVKQEDNSSQLMRWNELEESSRDLISDLRSDFIANLAGLKLAYAPSRRSVMKKRRPVKKAHRKAPASSRNQPPWVKNYAPPRQQAPKRAASVRAPKQPSRGSDEESNRDQGGWTNSNTNFNYYNVRQAELAKKLTGDVLHFDMRGNILDVFSSTISIRAERKTSILYRDKRFFSYSSPVLPLAVHRLFVQGDFVFVVHRDSTVLAKPMSSLSRLERKLVNEASAQVRKLCHWQSPPNGYTFALPKPVSGANSSSPAQEPQQQEDED